VYCNPHTPETSPPAEGNNQFEAPPLVQVPTPRSFQYIERSTITPFVRTGHLTGRGLLHYRPFSQPIAECPFT